MKIFKLLAFLFILNTVAVEAQIIRTKLDVITGIGAREYVHIGLRYQYTDITQLGLAIGGDLGIRENETITTYNLDHLIHFGQLSFNSNRPVWYARQGLTYSINVEGVQRTRKFTYLNLALGREFAVNNWLGFNADLGIIWQLKVKTEEGQAVIDDNLRYILPLARVQAFISF
jgi:hypothetical protein